MKKSEEGFTGDITNWKPKKDQSSWSGGTWVG